MFVLSERASISIVLRASEHYSERAGASIIVLSKQVIALF